MKVRDIIASALILLGRAEVASALSSGTVEAEEQETVDTLLYCFNAVENELARNYIPLVYREKLSSKDGKFSYVGFLKNPVRIKKVLSDGKAVNFTVYSTYLYADAEIIEIEYEYAPRRKKLTDDSDFGENVGMDIIAVGMAEEYSYINGEAEAGDIWKAKYRDLIDNMQHALPECAHLPPRRWV